MRIAIISFTQQGGIFAQKIDSEMSHRNTDWEVTRYAFWKYPVAGAVIFHEGNKLVSEIFTQYDGLIFVSATGIAVRLIAPCVVSKVSDPAVLCMDEQGTFVIALLSGHIGGANELTRKVAECVDAQPVITTATDVGGRFSPDSFAAANGLVIDDMQMVKEIAAAVVRGERIGLVSDYPYRNLPDGLELIEILQDSPSKLMPEYGICISKKKEVPFVHTLYLSPRDIVLGVGCRRDMEPETLEAFVLQKLEEYEIPIASVRCICSIDLKKKEQALLAFSRKYHIPFETFSAEELAKVKGDFETSAFVRETTGVDNVCERSAMIYGGDLIMSKQVSSGVTLAAGRTKVSLDFGKRVID